MVEREIWTEKDCMQREKLLVREDEEGVHEPVERKELLLGERDEILMDREEIIKTKRRACGNKRCRTRLIFRFRGRWVFTTVEGRVPL